MRKRLYDIIEQGHSGDKASIAYDIVMLVTITASIIPLMFIEDRLVFRVIEQVTVALFIIDYLLRWFTADYRVQKKGWSFVVYPFTGWAIIDLLSILPGLNILGKGFKILRITRLLRILRLFKFLRYSDKIQVLGRVIRKEKSVLCGLVLGYHGVSLAVDVVVQHHLDRTVERHYGFLASLAVNLELSPGEIERREI